VRRTVSVIMDAARHDRLFPGYRKAARAVVVDFRPWVRSAPQEDFIALIRDGWEVAHRAGRKACPEPCTQEDANDFLASLEDTMGEAGCIALMLLWRRHRQGNRYHSPFKKEAGHD
jgi:hypothetical protein